MKYRLITIFLLLFAFHSPGQEKKYFDKIKFSVYQGYRNINATWHDEKKQLDFLNYMYTQDQAADYPYFEMATKFRHLDQYQVDLRMALYNNLIPYCFNLSFDYYLNHEIAIQVGAVGNRYYLTEFNGFYNHLYGSDISTRYIQRQWNISLVGFYAGSSYELNYQSIELNLSLNAGMSSFYPFTQENIIKKPHSNYKRVLDYQTKFHFLPFVMPEIELSIDFMRYKNAIIGARIKYVFMYTKSAIKYVVTSYEWTYDSPEPETVLLPYHAFTQSDIDFGIFARW